MALFQQVKRTARLNGTPFALVEAGCCKLQPPTLTQQNKKIMNETTSPTATATNPNCACKSETKPVTAAPAHPQTATVAPGAPGAHKASKRMKKR